MTPQKTIERLIVYTTVLENLQSNNTPFVYSKQLAYLSGNSAAQVRRDLMFVGYSGTPQTGYDVSSLLSSIRKMLEPENGISMILVGVGNLGRALLSYFSIKKPKFSIVACFDRDTNKINRDFAETRCYHLDVIKEVIKDTAIQLGIITVPIEEAQYCADVVINAGINGIINFAPVPIRVPGHVYIEHMHITMTIEKAAYFSQKKIQEVLNDRNNQNSD